MAGNTKDPKRSEPFLLGSWTVDPVEGTLRRRDSVERLEPKVMAVLAYLASNRDRIVSKKELLSALWPDCFVEEVALARSVSEIRRALGDDARNPWCIKTYPKRGYRCIVSRRPAPRLAFAAMVLAAIIGASGLALLTLRAGNVDLPVARSVPSGSSTSPGVYDLYSQARAFYQRLDRKGVENAIELLDKALQLDPDFDLAHAGLADAYARKASFTGDRNWAGRGVDAARRAIVLDDELAEGHKSLGHALAARGDTRAAIAAYERAISLRPDYSDALNNLAVCYTSLGQWDDALRSQRRVLVLDPQRAIPRANFGEMLVWLELDREAEAWLVYALEVEAFYSDARIALAHLALLGADRSSARRVLREQLDVDPACHRCLHTLALVEQIDGDQALAQELLESSLELAGDPTIARLRLGQIAWLSGDVEEAKKWLDLAESGSQRAIGEGSEWWGPRWTLAAAAAVRGDREEAVRWLEEAYAAGRRHPRWDRLDPLFENARRDPRFEAVLERASRDVSEMRRRVEKEVPEPPAAAVRIARRSDF